ncbi:MAG TPA: hypothetical protein VMA86_11805, partial [Acetobacteraceae bacterium]|nr:hypothetical protein [Acetobacteraceae bacterium]
MFSFEKDFFPFSGPGAGSGLRTTVGSARWNGGPENGEKFFFFRKRSFSLLNISSVGVGRGVFG